MSANLTDSDRQFLEKAIFCMKAPPEVSTDMVILLSPTSLCPLKATGFTTDFRLLAQLDINKMAETLGVKPKSVTNRWCEIKVRIQISQANFTLLCTGCLKLSLGS